MQVQKSKDSGSHPMHSQAISTELDLKWSSQNTNWLPYGELVPHDGGLACYATALVPKGDFLNCLTIQKQLWEETENFYYTNILAELAKQKQTINKTKTHNKLENILSD